MGFIVEKTRVLADSKKDMPRLWIHFNANRNGSLSIVMSEATKLQEVDASLEEYSS